MKIYDRLYFISTMVSNELANLEESDDWVWKAMILYVW